MKVWIYLEGRQQGPFEMEDLASKPGFDRSTRVWFEGLPKWYPAGSLEQLAPLFEKIDMAARQAEARDTAAEPDAVTDEESTAATGTQEGVVTDTDTSVSGDVEPKADGGEAACETGDSGEQAPAEPSRVYYNPGAAPANPYAPGRMYRPAQQLSEPCPPTYLGWSVFLLICCCSPLSAGALAASLCVSSFYSQGKLDKAKKASEWAAWLIMISFALGMIPSIILSAIVS